jgi:hypothetical protein
VFRRINFANATPDELEQLTQACEVSDEAYCKAGKMDPECFSSSLDPTRTDLIKIIRDYLLEGKESTKNVGVEAYKLNIYSAHLIVHPYLTSYYIAVQAKGHSSSLMSILHRAKRRLGRS